MTWIGKHWRENGPEINAVGIGIFILLDEGLLQDTIIDFCI